MSLDFPLSVRSRNLCFFLSRKGEGGCVFAVFFSPVPEKEILDFIAHGSIIQVFTVSYVVDQKPFGMWFGGFLSYPSHN